MQRFLVSADHPVEKYRLNAAEFVVRSNEPGKFYADNQLLGCSKDYANAEQAIRAMCYDHGCSNIRIHPV